VGTRNIPIAEAGPRVADVMLRDPRTVAPDTTVGEARAQFENPRVRLVLVADGETFLGAVTRESLPGDAPDDAPLGPIADGSALRIAPGEPVQRALDEIDARGLDRIPVVDGDALVGLICFNSRHGHFCVDG
jgi:CBS domain-containing protein